MQDIRNIAVIAHVDHGKTTLVDKMMLAGKLFRDGQDNSGEVLDSNDLERERGITILSKNVSINWKGVKIISSILLDTPTSVVRWSACSIWQTVVSCLLTLSRALCLRLVSCCRKLCSSV